MTLKILNRIAKVFWDSQDYLRITPSGDSIRVWLICNDLFMWACADAEEITQDNIELLESTYVELKKLGLEEYTDILFCCRVRGKRPQIPYYKHIDEKAQPLFDACGARENQCCNGYF